LVKERLERFGAVVGLRRMAPLHHALNPPR
jgi:hypothetical protein